MTIPPPESPPSSPLDSLASQANADSASANTCADTGSDKGADVDTDTGAEPSAEPSAAARWYDVALKAGKVALGAALRAGRAAGQAAAQAYNAVDPDLRRHFAQMPLLGVSYLSPRRASVEPLPDDGQRVVLCVHGLGGHPGNFMGLRAYLKLMGRTRLYSASFPQGAGLPEMADHLRALIEEIFRVNALSEDTQIDIIAHSMGGIVTRLALRDEGCARRVAKVVTLGTPHAGTWTARYASTIHTLELRPDSETMTALAAQVPWPPKPALVAFWSQADVLIVPGESATLEGAQAVEMPGYTHYGYLIHPKAWERILRTLHED